MENEISGNNLDNVCEEEKWYSVDDILSICNSSLRTFRNFSCATAFTSENMKTTAHNKKYYTETVLKQFQAWLMKNQANQGSSPEIVKQQVENAVVQDLALKEIIASGNVEAMKCLMEHYVNETAQIQKVKELEQQNKQLNHALEYDKVKDWLRWNPLKKQLKYKGSFTTIAQELKLVEGEDFERKVMGNDKYPTILITPEIAEKIFEEYNAA